LIASIMSRRSSIEMDESSSLFAGGLAHAERSLSCVVSPTSGRVPPRIIRHQDVPDIESNAKGNWGNAASR
jgi:hypothetical protein